jgi:D-alanyl-D-alanine carboxypeptidase
VLRAIVFVVVSLTAALTGFPARADSATIGDTLSRAVASHNLAGAIAVVRDRADVTRYTAGLADVDARTGFAPNTHIRAASITKMFVAAVVLQLAAEDKVNLDAPIERYLPGRIRGDGINAGAITVRQLLRHQSGLGEYFDDTTEIPAEPVTADQLLDMALTHPAQFAPGVSMKYTNTNYVVAGLLIERLTGVPAGEEITRRVIAPLGLVDTYFPAPGDTGLRAPSAQGYELIDGRQRDVTEFNASAAGMSGMLVSTNEDTSAFITALLHGRVVPRPQLDQMMDAVPMPDGEGLLSYGLGLGKVSLPCGKTAWGHGGDVEGFHSFVAKTADGPAISVTFTQSPEASKPSEDPRGDILADLYCPR